MCPETFFPCATPFADKDLLKLSGVYAQRQNGLWMQRIKIQGGSLEPEDWRTLAALARTHTPDTPLLITTRQCIEFHNIAGEQLSGLQQGLARAGFTGQGACGDTLRNITLCPGNGLCPGSADFSAAAATTRKVLESFNDVYRLPRKFKISFSGCERFCAQPFINDLGFAALVRDGRITIKLFGAGSLGARPETGIELDDNVNPDQIPALALAALRIFNTHGNRKNRRKARLRHIRQTLGNDAFIALLRSELKACAKHHVPGPLVALSTSDKLPAAQISVPCGLLTPDQAEALADVLVQSRACARIQNHHCIEIFAKDRAALCACLHANPVLHQLQGGPDIVSCPGTTYCSQAIVNTHAAERLLRENLPPGFATAIRISGCPNGCSHATIAPIGLSGRIKKNADGTPCEGFQILTGGGLGLKPGCGQIKKDFVPTKKIAEYIQNISAPTHESDAD